MHSIPITGIKLSPILLGDEAKEVFKGKNLWVQDCSAATENILIAAEDKGLGAVWLGVYPLKEIETALKELLNLPANIHPLSIIPIGYSDEQREPSNRFDKSRIHYNKW